LPHKRRMMPPELSLLRKRRMNPCFPEAGLVTGVPTGASGGCTGACGFTDGSSADTGIIVGQGISFDVGTPPRKAGDAGSTALFVFPHGDRAFVADSAVRPALRRVEHVAAPATPSHVPPVACAPHRTDRPSRVAVVVAARAARGWHDRPSALGRHEVADEVVGEFVARFGHGDVQPELPTGYPRRRLMNAATEGAAQQRLSARSRSVIRPLMTHEMSRFSAREGVPSAG
jgi:hypothetical protein